MNKKHLFTVLSAGLFVGISLFAAPLVPHAQAAGFTVDSLGDGSDSNQGNGLCDDGSGNCTLRAAIQEVNALGGSGHTIGFASGGVITLSIQLPTIMAGVTIDGTTVAGASCDMNSRNLPVEIDLSSFHNPFVVNASSVTIKGLTMYHVNDSSTLVFYSGSSDGFVLCNNINTDTLGSQVAAVPSHINSQGISADRVDRLTIGLPGEGNVIGGSSTPISISNSSVVKLFGNVLGLNAKTDAALNPSVQQTGATFNGTSDITIGGPNPGEGNVISGMQEPSANSQGLSFDSSSNIVIQGNYIGTNNDGTVEFGNAAQGIEICGGAILCNGAGTGVSDITIGGPNPGEGNVISGNGIMSNGEGILAADATGVLILNNLIGTKAGGDEALPNENGISIQGGSDISILDNVISGNSSNGVTFSEGVNPVSNLTFLRNKIGVGLDGTTALGNKTGVALFGPSTLPLEIGSTTLVDANSIVNNTDYGMLVLSLSSDMQIKYNYIGVLSSGAAAPNGLGVVIVNTPFGHLTITKNLIKNNLGDGIVIFDSPLVGPFLPAASTNTIIDNVITGNGGLGIELADDQVPDLSFPVPDTNVGPNLNDLGDTDAGVNDYLNYPVINKVIEITPGNLDISYYLDVPAGTYRVELYKNPTNGLDPSFHGEGESLVYVDTVTTAGGMINRHVPVAVPGTVADVVTATATEDLGAGVYGKTSEFGTTVPGTGSGTAAGIDTGNTSILAPANGAYHLLGTNYLGSCVNADNDNATSIPGVFVGTGPCANDNDGLTLAAYYDAGDAVVLAPTMSAPGIINVWIDYNNNGDYLDLGEHVISQNTTGVIPPFVVPPATPNGNYPLRIRYVSDISKINTVVPGEASPLGEALDGEAEDYVFRVGAPSVPSAPPSGGAPAGSTSGGAPAACRDPKASNYRAVGAHDPLLCAYGGAPAQPKTTTLLNTGTSTTLDQKACPYFTQYLKSGAKNSKAEVTKWQNFLNEILGLKLKVNGTYDKATVNAVNRFQLLFASDVLTPWGLGKPTGYTYKTTRMKANQMVNCPEPSVTLEGSGNGKTWVLPALK